MIGSSTCTPLRRAVAVVAVLAATTLTACGGGGTDDSSSAPAAGGTATPATPNASALSATAQLGEALFKDPALSASGQMACATCHNEDTVSAPGNGLAVQLGGPLLDQQGVREAPGIRYLRTNRAFAFASDGTPTGGFFWDGRAASLQAQAAEPFLNPFEMALPSKDAVIAKVRQASYAPAFVELFGAAVLADTEQAYDRITFAIAQYEKEDAEFAAFTSKYDAFLRGTAQLTDVERRGLALFNDPQKGNCAGCHPSARGADGSLPLFTDFTYDNLGVPRNPDIARNADPDYFDLGLCARPDGSLANRPDLCGAFKVPSLRNVAQRRTYFHNGRFKTLKEALQFYVQRDTNPERFYPVVNGTVAKFDDLPLAYHANVNRTEVPYNRNVGDDPALSDAEIDDLIVFLKTLDDGFQ
jgi:cytochrome c peroxidase